MIVSRPKIIGFAGFIGAGKDTAAKVLEKHYGYALISFSEPLDEALRALNPVIDWYLDDWDTLIIERYGDLRKRMSYEEVKRKYPEARELLQRIGTEVGRKQWGEHFWRDIALAKVPEHGKAAFVNVRYENEATGIWDAGGHVLKVVNPRVKRTSDHSSEDFAESYNPPENLTIHNTGTLADLEAEMLNKLAGLQ